MKTTNKVQTGDTTSASASYININSNYSYKSEKGWECPRCGRINAPWVRQCDCSPSTSTWDNITINPCNKQWWTQITCSPDTFKIHPESITTSVNQAVDDSDYQNSVTGGWTNVPKTYTNSVKR